MQPGAGERKSSETLLVAVCQQTPTSRHPTPKTLDSLKNTGPFGLSSQAELEAQRWTHGNKIRQKTDSFTKLLAIFFMLTHSTIPRAIHILAGSSLISSTSWILSQ